MPPVKKQAARMGGGVGATGWASSMSVATTATGGNALPKQHDAQELQCSLP